jgi:tetratricopeptide (TPR) repeat protein
LTDGRVAALAAALGTTEKAIYASYNAWADEKVNAHRSELDFEAAEAEAQARRVTSDWAGMVVALRKALKAKPGDAQTLFNIASAQMRDGDLVGAEASIKSILAAPLGPGESRFRIFGHYQLGRVYDLAGRRAEALAQYDAVLALPDEQGAHALARDRKAAPATREQLE